jgi:uncharacterized protein
MPRTTYVAELNRLQRDAAASYLLLQRLWQADEQGIRRFGLRQQGRDLGIMQLQRLERTPWTELLEMTSDTWGKHAQLSPLQLQIRIYHDVRLAEVVSCQQFQPREGRYAYPNEAMFHPDEKVQVNDLLVQWLKFALERGYALQTAFEPDA